MDIKLTKWKLINFFNQCQEIDFGWDILPKKIICLKTISIINKTRIVTIMNENELNKYYIRASTKIE